MDQENSIIDQVICEIEKLQKIEDSQINGIEGKVNILKKKYNDIPMSTQNHRFHWIAFPILLILIYFYSSYRVN